MCSSNWLNERLLICQSRDKGLLFFAYDFELPDLTKLPIVPAIVPDDEQEEDEDDDDNVDEHVDDADRVDVDDGGGLYFPAVAPFFLKSFRFSVAPRMFSSRMGAIDRSEIIGSILNIFSKTMLIG